MNQIVDGWFSEKGPLWPGQAMSLEVDEVLHNAKTQYQDLLVFKSKNWGKVLVLDGVIQVTERDEFSYQEMIVHLPMCAHPDPKKVLIIGGGDGGVLREVCKHQCVEQVFMCEIDQGVIDASKQFFPQMACSFNDPRLQLFVGDGNAFLDGKVEQYDVIITDSSDPIGPASALFEKLFYEKLKRALKPGGILCCQMESIWLHLDIIKNMSQACRELGFASVQYAFTTIPTYPSGQIGFLLCSKEVSDLSVPKRNLVLPGLLRYYNAQVHTAAFVLPEFARQALSEV
eukprot:gnl/Hemi2/23180_TR7775_c0_g1_i1.p1 gnl/Hemi2/23180_TR7775_c0_g1~~gnl/Hemi2/23180_TR7775_c0_g1_i1.p1  ORF type:complete len:300 (+),score=118.19 gnl/Hemi2/23180_TR7775_c0_g1_i1:44-901(+)